MKPTRAGGCQAAGQGTLPSAGNDGDDRVEQLAELDAEGFPDGIGSAWMTEFRGVLELAA
jgi:hypothetical protein